MISRQSVDALLSSKRILVLGPCGSGKTCLTRQLSRILELPAVHLDANFWHPGWVSTPQPEWRCVVSSLIKKESWIMDGTYESTLDLRIPAAEAIIVVKCPRWISLWGVIRRSMIYRNKPRPDAPSNQPIDLAYLQYIWKYPVQTDALVNELIKEHGPDIPVIRLGNRKSIESFISALQANSSGLYKHQRIGHPSS
ncbi:MAG: adenylate kinase [Gammaproteobacteria bacterium]|nr:MAG: adenylate kinase [Gammaproteobacteria bacterium]